MSENTSETWRNTATLIGAAVFFGIMYLAVFLNSAWWRQISAQYAGKSGRRMVARKIPETIIVTSRGGVRLAWPLRYWRIYAASAIKLHEDGLVITQIPPFNIMCPPLFLPFSEMEISETYWPHLPLSGTEPCAIRMRRIAHTDIIVARRIVSWVRENLGDSPFGLRV